jgi:predicted histone-like DNA-binding protein
MKQKMAVKFRVIQKKNPQDLAAAPKSYAIAVSDGTVDIDRLSVLVGDGSTVRQNDIYAVIIGLVNVIQGELSEGRSVNLGKLGTFSIGVSSNGSDTEEEVTASNIKNAKVNYRPGKELKNMLKTLSYTKVTT